MAVVEKEYLEKVVVIAEGATINITDYIEGEFKIFRSNDDLIFIGLDTGERVRFTDLITLSLAEDPAQILDKDGEVIDYLSTDLEFEGVVEVAETNGLGLSWNNNAIGGTLNYSGLLGYVSQAASAPKGSMLYSGSSPYEEVTSSSVISSAANLVADEDLYTQPVKSQLVKSNPLANLDYQLLSSPKTDYGTFTLNSDGSYEYKLDDSTKVQALKQNQKVVETVRVRIFDRDTGEEAFQDIDVTILGRNDAPEVNTEASILSGFARAVPDYSVVSGNVSVSDIDGDLIYSEVSSKPMYGTLSMNGSEWMFTVDRTHPAISALGAGELLSDTALILLQDSYGGQTYIALSLTVEGTQDAPIITSQSVLTGDVYEDVSTGMVTSGIVRGEDKDRNDTLTFKLSDPSQEAKYGTLLLNPDGTWRYVLDNGNDVVNALNDGETLVEKFQVYVTDGKDNSAPVTITVVIHGSSDAPELDATVVTMTEDTAELAGSVASSALSADHIYSVTGLPAYGTIVMNKDGSYTYKLNTTHPFVDSLAPGQSVTDTIIVEVKAPSGKTGLSTITITITGENDAPTINAGVTRAIGIVEEDSAIDTVFGMIVGQDVDNGDKLAYTLDGDDDKDGKVESDYGTFTLNADGSWSYVLDNKNDAVQALGKGDSLTDTIIVVVTDKAGETAKQEIKVIIKGNDEAPYIDQGANGDDLIISVTEDKAREEGLDYDAAGKLTNIVKDPEGGEMTFKALGSSQYGTLKLNADGTYTFVLNHNSPKVQALAKGEVVTETIPVVVTDEGGNQLQITITINITGTNDVPAINVGATDETAVIGEDDTVPAKGKIIAEDIDGDELTFSLKADLDGDGKVDGLYGTLTLDENGRWTYVLDNNNSKVQALNASSKPLTDVIIVVVTDEHGAKVEQAITITIKGADEAPYVDEGAAGSHVIKATEDDDSEITGSLKDYVVDPEAKPLAFKLMAGSKYGELTLESDGSYSFKLDNSLRIVQEISKGQKVYEVIPIMVEDEAGNILSTTITVEITGTNDVPTVNVGQSILTGTAVEDNYNLITSGKVVGDDVDQADILEYTLKGAEEGANDLAGTYGTLTLNADGTWIYALDHSKVQSLNSGDKRQDSFTIIIDDGNGGKKEATVVIDVLGTNEGPIVNVNGDGSSYIKATEDVATPVTGNLTGDITSPDGDTLTFRSLADSQYGTLTVNSDGTYSFTLNNSLAAVQALSKGQKITEVLPIIVSDGVNELNTTITIEITGVNDDPTINVGSTIATGDAVEDNAAPVKGKIVGADIDQNDKLEYALKGDTDADGKMDGSYGQFILNKDGTWEYKLTHSNTTVQALDEGESLTDTVTVVVSDGNGGSVEQAIVVTILGTNEAPKLDLTPNGKDTIAVSEDATSPVTGDMNDYVSDPEGDALKFALQGSSHYGTLTLNADGTYSYKIDNSLPRVQELAAGQVIVETIPILVTDKAGNQLSTYIKVKITGQNDAPTIDIAATDSTDLVVEDSFMRIATGKVIGKDVDNGDTLSYSIETVDDGSGNNTNMGKYGTFKIDAKTGAWTYILNNAHDDVQALDADDDPIYDTITVTVTDSHGASATQVVTVTIMGQDEPNQPPKVTGGTEGAITEDASPNTVAGTVTYSDADGDDVTFSAIGRPSYGDFVIDSSTGAWTYTLNNKNAVVNSLSKGEVLKDYVTIELDDGNGGTVKKNVEITITGANDAPEFTGLTDVDETMFNTANTASGQVAISDVDTNDSHTYSLKDGTNTGTSLDGSYGTFAVDSNGKWTYTLDKTHNSVATLPGGTTLTDTITITVSDGTATIEEKITVIITGTNTAPSIDGGTSGTITENGVANQSNELTGKITASDNEGDKLTYKIVNKDGEEVTVLEGKYGTLEITATGSWTYTLNNNNADVNQMTDADTLRESFDIVVSDGLASEDGTINITIKGANDRPIIASSYENVIGSVSDATPTVKATGTIEASDVDTGDRFTFTVNNDGNFGTGINFGDKMSVEDANGYGTFAITSAGAWTYTLKQPLHADIKALGAGESLDIKLYVKAIDEAGNALSNNQSVVTITINGSNDDPTLVSATDTGKVKEDGAITDTSDEGGKATGTIVYADLDIKDTHSVTIKEGTNTAKTEYTSSYGTFKLVMNPATKTETWEYVLDSSKVQHLKEGETVTETMTIVVDDGKGEKLEITVTVTVTGTNDLPTVNAESVFAGAVTEAAAGDDDLTATGKVTFDDVDTGDTITYSIRYKDANGEEKTITVDNNFPAAGLKTEYGTIKFDADTGEWTFVLDDEASNSKVNGLDAGEKVNNDFVIIGTDSAGGKKEQNVTIVITGTNEDPVLDVSGSKDTVVWSNNGSSAVDATVTDEDTIGVYLHESNDSGYISGKLVASDVNLTDGEDGANDGAGNDILAFKLNGSTPITITYPDGTTETYSSIADFNENNIYGATLTLNTSTGEWTFKTDRTNNNFLGLKFDEFVNINIGVIVEDGQGGSDNKNINIKIEGGQQDLNYIHEYGGSNILEWIKLEVAAEISGDEVVDYNEDGLGSGAYITSITLPQGTTGWSITTADGKWIITHTDGYSVTISPNGTASFSGNLAAGSLIDLPIIVAVKDGGVERTFNGTKIIATDHQETGFFTSDGSKEATVVMDYQTYVTTEVSSSDEGTPSTGNLANAVIGAKNGGRTYLHIFGHSNGGSANVANTINVATAAGASITVADPNSFLFLEVRADNPEASGAGADVINLGKGTVNQGTKGVAIELEGGSSKDTGGSNNTINMDAWSFGGEYNYISLIGDSEKDPGTYGGTITLSNTIIMKNQTFTGGESFFRAIGAGIYENGANFTAGFSTSSLATMNFETFASTGSAKTHVFLASTMVGSVDRGNNGLTLLKSEITGKSIVASDSSVAEYSIAPIYGDIKATNFTAVGAGASARTGNNKLTIDTIKSEGSANLTVNIAGINVGNITLTAGFYNSTENIVNISNVIAAGTSTLNFYFAGASTGNFVGSATQNDRDSYDRISISGISVEKGATLNFESYSFTKGDFINAGGVNGSNLSGNDYTFGDIAGTANIKIAQVGGWMSNMESQFRQGSRINGLNVVENSAAKLKMDVAANSLGSKAVSNMTDSDDSVIVINGKVDIRHIAEDTATDEYGVRLFLSSMYAASSNLGDGTSSFAFDKGWTAPWHSTGNGTAYEATVDSELLTAHASDFKIYGGGLHGQADTTNAYDSLRGYVRVAASQLGEDGNVMVFTGVDTLEGSGRINPNRYYDVITLGKGDDVVYAQFNDASKFTGLMNNYHNSSYHLGGGSDVGYSGLGAGEYWFGDRTVTLSGTTGAGAGPEIGATSGTDQDLSNSDIDVLVLRGTWGMYDASGSTTDLDTKTSNNNGERFRFNVSAADFNSGKADDFKGTVSNAVNIYASDFEVYQFDDGHFKWNDDTNNWVWATGDYFTTS